MGGRASNLKKKKNEGEESTESQKDISVENYYSSIGGGGFRKTS